MPGNQRFLQPIRSILESSRNGIAIISRDGTIVFQNESLEQLSGLPFARIRGKKIAHLFPASDVADLEELTGGTRTPKRISMYLQTPGGVRSIPVFVSRIVEQEDLEGFLLVVLPTSSGAPAKRLTEKHHSILRVISVRAREACSIIDIITGETLFMSSSIQNLTGWDRDDFLKGGFGFGMSLLHPDDSSEVMRVFQEEVEKRNREPFLHDHRAWNVDLRYRKPDGSYVRFKTETMLLERNDQLKVQLIMTTLHLFETNQKTSREAEATLPEESIRIIDGKPYINIEFLNRLRSQSKPQSEDTNVPELTDRERQILRLLAEGLSSEKISKKLNISINTVSTYRKQLLKKLDARNAPELIRKAQKLGMLH